MKILQDSREQLPLEFNHELITETIIMPLPVGDYSCEFESGLQVPIIFERKSIGDLFSTLSGGYERFKREIEKAKSLDIKLILIVEGTLTKVLKGYKHSKRGPLSLIRQMFMLWIKHDIYPVFCKDRAEMTTYIIEFYAAIGRKALEDAKEARREQKRV